MGLKIAVTIITAMFTLFRALCFLRHHHPPPSGNQPSRREEHDVIHNIYSPTPCFNFPEEMGPTAAPKPPTQVHSVCMKDWPLSLSVSPVRPGKKGLLRGKRTNTIIRHSLICCCPCCWPVLLYTRLHLFVIPVGTDLLTNET